MLVPTYAGFAAGFVLWGASSALMSGTFEALVYDELTATGPAGGYARLLGWAESAAMVANLAATAACRAAVRLGRLPAGRLGRASCSRCSRRCSRSLLPRARPVEAVDETRRAAASARYVAGRDAARRARRGRHRPRVRHVVADLGRGPRPDRLRRVLPAAGCASRASRPRPCRIVLAVVVAAQAVGTGFAGRTEGCRPARWGACSASRSW